MNRRYTLSRRELLGSGTLVATMSSLGLSVGTGAVSGQQASTDDWPMFGYDAGATSHNPTASGPRRRPTEAWSTGGLGDGIHPVIADGEVYVNGTVLNDSDGSGDENIPFGFAPIVDGTSLYTSLDGDIASLNRSDGSEQWSFTPEQEADSVVPKPPVLYDGTLYVCYNFSDTADAYASGTLYALDPIDGTELWRNEEIGNIFAQPVASDDGVVLAARSDGTSVLSFDLDDGTKQWERDRALRVRTTPTVSDGVVYAGNQVQLMAIDATTGTIRWEFEEDEREFNHASVAVSDETVVATTRGDVYDDIPAKVYGLDLDGTKRWELTASADRVTPAIADGTVFVGADTEPNVLAIDEESGERLWDRSFDDDSVVDASLAVVGDRVYVPTEDGTLHVFEEAPNEPPTPEMDLFPTEPIVGETVTFDGSVSTDDTGIDEYRWTVTGPERFVATGVEVSNEFTESGEYEVELAVVDEDGVSETTRRTFTVEPEPTATETPSETETDKETRTETETSEPSPTKTESDERATETTASADATDTPGELSAAFTFRPTGPPVGETVEFDAGPSETPADRIVAYEWNFDNGETAAGQQVSQTFEEVGHFFVELTVTDSNGNTARTEQEVRTVRGGAGATGPGFGLTSALASLGGVGYLLKQRFDDE